MSLRIFVRATSIGIFLWACAASLQAQEAQLRAGQAVYGPQQPECSGSFILDNVVKLCNLIPGASCTTAGSTCRTYTRQVFTGTRLGPVASTPAADWNGMGGSGELMADALICSLRELSPQIKGPIKTPQLSIDLGLGLVTATQEIGFKDFQRVNPKFNGYRKITLSLPVVGKAEAITQSITVTKRTYSAVGAPALAGGRPIQGMYALDIASEDKQRNLTIKPPAFTVPTPIGPFEAAPLFTYTTRTAVIAAPYTAPNLDIPQFLGSTNTVRFSDLFGIDPGIAATAKKVFYGTIGQNRTGWLSQLGLGTRGTHTDKSVWNAPSTGPKLRPDLDPYKSRSSAEAQPSVYVKAEAILKYPKTPDKLLPGWVFGLPGLTADAYITVTPKVEASVAGQFTIASGEGSNYVEAQEFRFSARRFASSSLVAGLRTSASFSVEVRLRIYVKASFPIIGSKTIIDVDVRIPVPLYKDSKSSAAFLGGAVSTGGELPESLDLLRTLHGAQHVGGSAASAFIQQCYAPGNQPPPNQVTAEPAQPGQPKDLFTDVLMPCNLCIAIDNVYDGTKIVAPAHYSTVMPSNPPPSGLHWKCDMGAKSGCMDLCKVNPATGALTAIVRGPAEIAALLPVNDKNRALYLKCNLGVVK